MAPSLSRFLIWGAGGHGRVLADLVRACGYELVGFIDGDAVKQGHVAEPGGARVVLDEQAFLEELRERRGYPDRVDAVALGIGNNHSRQRSLARLAERCVPPLVHPSAVVSPSASVGRGSVVLAGVVINAGTRIGDAVIVNSAAVVEHDCVVADAAHISPHATLAGGVRVGERSWVGAGATVIQNIVIGPDSVVGAGAVAIRDVPEGTTVVGVPAAPLVRG